MSFTDLDERNINWVQPLSTNLGFDEYVPIQSHESMESEVFEFHAQGSSVKTPVEACASAARQLPVSFRHEVKGLRRAAVDHDMKRRKAPSTAAPGAGELGSSLRTLAILA